jgi:hypothetical protein
VRELLIHFYIFGVIYAIGFIGILCRISYVARKGNVKMFVPKWFGIALLDSLLWPYYVLRYGVEGFYNEIK